MLMGKQLLGRCRVSSRHGDSDAPPGHPHLGYKTSPEIGGGKLEWELVASNLYLEGSRLCLPLC